jgi:hypothetical protein
MEVKLGIGIPLSWHYVPSDFFDSFIQMKGMGEGHIIRAQAGPIHEMRNTISMQALKLDCTHLIFIDCDMVYPADTIMKLLSHDKDIIGALTFKRWPPFNPIVYEGEQYKMSLMDPIPDDSIVEVTATGTGCLMIKTEVFDHLDYPWFEFTQKDDKPVGEDINFCYRARDAGYKIYIDTSIMTEHLAQMRVNYNMWQLNKSLGETGNGFKV